jgi:molybdate transport system substrate-binding protein
LRGTEVCAENGYRMLKRFAVLFLAAVLTMSHSAMAAGLTVFAASSLTDAFKDIGVLWQAQGHKPITFSFDSSSTLARQIDAGAPADIFVSADTKWMDYLAKRGKIRAATRMIIAGNTLVLVQPRTQLHTLTLAPGVQLAPLLGPNGRLAVGDPAHVPAGIYARQALIWLEAWDSLKDRLAPAESVRDALRLVQTGDAPMGIVYASDVRQVPSIAVAGTFPAASHDPIVYPAAVTKNATNRDATGFVAFLTSGAARDVFAHYGFTPP